MVDNAVDRSSRRHLASIFGPQVIKELGESGHSPFLNEVVASSSFFTESVYARPLRLLYQGVYDTLTRGPRPEYVYRNAIVTKRLISRHSLNKTTLVPEFRIGDRKADLVVLNGTSTAYEIKSDLDSFERLQGQMEQYLNVFDNVYLVVGPNTTEKALLTLPERIGVLELTDRYTIKKIRDSQPNAEDIDPAVLFDSLRKPEICDVVTRAAGSVPDCPNMHLRSYCKEIFYSLARRRCHNLAFDAIRRHRKPAFGTSMMRDIPHCLSAAILSSRLKPRQLARLASALDWPLGS